MADDVVPDRPLFTLDSIKDFSNHVPIVSTEHVLDAHAAIRWLIAEVERLREKNDRQVVYGQAALDVAEENVALRGALQALVDAVDDNEFAGFFTARAAAVALLAGPGGET